MSGIYGYSYRTETASAVLCDTIGALEYWNRIYGREDHGQTQYSDSGIGCHVEHFSDKFPYGGPVLDHNGCPAVVDALLYNRDELTELLHLDKDCSLSDEELLLFLIEVKGFQALALVNGDFAGAILDPKTGEWTLFRDHMGVRPLYYYLDDTCFAFSTDLRGLAAMPQADMKIDEMQFFTAASGGNQLSLQKTDYTYIRCIRPASVTRVWKTNTGFSLKEDIFWSLKQKTIRFSTDAQYQQELRRLITDSVNRRCDAIPGLLGGELSGGLDSTVIDILMCRHNRQTTFYSWSWDYDLVPMQDGEDERRCIEEICKRENTECHFRHFNDAVPLESVGEHVIPPYYTTYPIGYGSAWLRKCGARVVFTGHGGDEGVSHRGGRYELFYHREYSSYFKHYWKDLEGMRFRLPRALRACLKSAAAEHRRFAKSNLHAPNHQQIFQPAFYTRMLSDYAPAPFSFHYDPCAFVMQGGTRMRMDNVAYQGAVHGVRYLFPYVDHRVMDFALSIPRRQHIGYNRNRYIFREAFRDILPENLYNKTYKYQASTQHLSADTVSREVHLQQVERILTKLDPEVWSDYLDIEKLRVLLYSYNGEFGGIGSLDSLLDYLYRCTLIQDVQQNAKRWREFDEQDKTV